MNKRYGSILIVSVTILVLCFAGTASATNWSVDDNGVADCTSIQEAINNAKDGDTILVHSGVYYENVVVDKLVTLMGIGQPVVDAGEKGDAIRLTADGITLAGFNATTYGWGTTVIKVTSNNNSLLNNTCFNRGFDENLWDYSIDLTNSSNNSLSNNNCTCISLQNSNNNHISNNTCSNNRRGGIRIRYSNNNKLIGNALVESGLFIWGDSVSNYTQEIDTSNTVNGKPVYYRKDASGGRIADDAGQVILVNCTNVTVENQNINNASVGINIAFSHCITIRNNTCSYNRAGGISLMNSSNCSISDNICSNNNYVYGGEGIYLRYSSNNSISRNICSNNGAGISLWPSDTNTISNNTCSNNHRLYIWLMDGAYWYGSGIEGSGLNNRIYNNTCSNNDRGIYLEDSSNNSISSNTVCNNSWHGIDLWGSSKNTITGNTFVNDSLFLTGSYQNTVEDNTVNGKPLVYLKDVSNYKVEDAGQVILVKCNNITVENLDLSNTICGVELWKTENSRISSNKVSNNLNGISLGESNNNTITGNNASNNNRGIVLEYSSNNTISSNTVCNNSWRGIYLKYSRNNKIYFNNFINNTDNVDFSSYYLTNIWNSPLEITYTYNGTTYKSYVGNYWGDYEGTDAEGDGIGDTHYSIDSEKDESDDYPLMKPFENSILTTSAPA